MKSQVNADFEVWLLTCPVCVPQKRTQNLYGRERRKEKVHHCLFQQNPRNLILNAKKLGDKNRTQVYMQLLPSIFLQAGSYFWPSQGPGAATKSA